MNHNEIDKNLSPKVIKQMQQMQKIYASPDYQRMQKILASPAYQEMVRQNAIFNISSIQAVLNFKLQENFYKLQPLMTNENFLSALATSQNFLNAATTFQDNYKNFVSEYDKLNSEEQKKFNEVVDNELDKKSIYQTLKDTSEKTKKKIIELIKNLVQLATYAKNLFKIYFYPIAKNVLNTVSDLKTISPVLDEIKNNIDNIENFDLNNIECVLNNVDFDSIALALNSLDNLIKFLAR